MVASTGSGLEPVVSTPMPMTWAVEKPGLPDACCKRRHHAFFQAVEIVGRVLPRQMMVVFVEQNALVSAGIIDHGTAQFRARGAIDNQRPNRIRTVINT